MRLLHERDGDHHVEQAGPQDRDEYQSKKQAWEGQDDVHEAHDDLADGFTGRRGKRAKRGADDDRKGHRAESDHK